MVTSAVLAGAAACSDLLAAASCHLECTENEEKVLEVESQQWQQGT